MKKRLVLPLSIFVSLLSVNTFLWGGTSGKIAGRITDSKTAQSLPLANIIVEGTTLGAASDMDGYYVILNVPPGTYTVTTRMMGYRESRIENVKVSVDFTTTVNFNLEPTVIEAEGITVVAEREPIQVDLTSTRAVVDAARIEELPVESFQDLVNLQAGVVEGHIRGGRSSEVVYMLDGISITDPFSYDVAVDVENSIVQELQVISGTFNAEYGQAMSGIVNIVTKEGIRTLTEGEEQRKLTGKITSYAGDYVSNHTETFMNIDDINPSNIYNIEATLGGFLPFSNKLSFYLTGRRYYNEGFLYGERIFNPSDSCDFSADNPNDWYVGATGDSAMVPMAPVTENSYYGKLSYRHSPEDRFSYIIMWNGRDWKEYNHSFTYNPDGDYKIYERGYTHILNWNHVINAKSFFEFKLANSFHDFRVYVYEDSLDPRYVDPERLNDASNYAFLTGGTQIGHFYRNTTSYTGKFDITSQVTNTHQLKAGIEAKGYKLFLHEYELVAKRDAAGNQIYPFEPDIPPLTSTSHNKYTNYPFEGAVYVQDKIEFKDLIANIGIRFDYFNSNWKIPTDARDPNPVDPIYPDTANPYDPDNPIRVNGDAWFEDSKPQMQISPRIGLSYPITDRGVMHGSYGHFFQMPPFQYLYTDPEFEVYPLGLNSLMGNATLEAQKTVIYEIGLQQQLSDNITFDITGYFKNIRNLLGVKIYETYILGRYYAQYINRDYGNVRGVTISLEGRYAEFLYASLDYTYQIAKGNASDPNAVFWDAQANREPEKFLVPLDWDQTHTINASLTIGYPKYWGISFIGSYGSGFPYTPIYQGLRIARENSERKPAHYNVDLMAYKNFNLAGGDFQVFLKIYNLLDRMNEVDVYAETGRATYTIIENPGVVRGINTLEEWLVQPNFYSAPREIVFGFSVAF